MWPCVAKHLNFFEGAKIEARKQNMGKKREKKWGKKEARLF